MKIALIVSMLVILGAVIFFLVQRQTAVSAKAATGAGGGDVDPVTGQRWQTVAEAQHAADAAAATQSTGAVLA